MGCDAQVHQVRKAFEKVGYAFAHKEVGARSFLAPSATHARLDVGCSLGRSGRSSGRRGADSPQRFGKGLGQCL